MFQPGQESHKRCLVWSQLIRVSSSMVTVLTSFLWVQEEEEVEEAATAIIS